MMIAKITGTRRRVALIGSTVALGVGAVALTAAAAGSGGAAKPPAPSHRYADYVDDHNGDQCALPVAQRTGGWVCP